MRTNPTLLSVASLLINLTVWAPAARAQGGKWLSLPPFPEPHEEVIGQAANGKMYVIGGATTAPGATGPSIHPTIAQRVLGTVEEYDPETNTWRARSTMPTPRNHTAAGVVDNKIYVIGGRIGAAFIAASSDLSNVEAYDPATDTWSRPLAKMPTARSGLDVGVYKGRIYIAGGENQDFFQHTAYHAFEAYDPATNTCTILTPMPLARHHV